MKTTWLISFGLALLLFPAAGAATGPDARPHPDPPLSTSAPEPVAQGEFAEGVTLTPKSDAALHTVLLPEAVYRGLAQPNFSDLRVYNRAGSQVPHALRPLPVQQEPITKSAHLPLFPLRAAPGSADPATAVVLYALRDSGGTIVTIRPEPAPAARAPESPPEPAGKLVAYVVDASTWPEPIDALEISLSPEPGPAVLPITVEASDDLANFRRVGQPQSLVLLEYAGQRIERTRIDLPRVRARYLRLSWSGPDGRSFQAVRAESGSVRREDAAVSRKLGGMWSKPGELALYDLGGPVPVDQVRVLLAEDNTLISATLEAATDQDGPFSPLAQGTFYRVRHQGQLVESPAVSVARTAARFLRLRISPQGGGAGTSAPELELSRQPDQLLFAARGEAPFELVFGHYGARGSAFSPEELLAMLPEAARDHLPASDTSLSSVYPLAGPGARVAPPPGPPLKKYALWAVLLAAVGALALMAARLARSQTT